MQEQPTRVLVVGAENLAAAPPLFENQQFSEWLFADPSRAKLLDLSFAPPQGRAAAGRTLTRGPTPAARWSRAPSRRRSTSPRLFRPARRLPQGHRRSQGRTVNHATGNRHCRESGGQPAPLDVPSPEIICNTANDKSQLASLRLSELLRRWTQRIGEDNLKLSGVSVRAAHPFSVDTADVADARRRNGAVWSKILPVLLLLWALTGAFYPAIDLCAGEKERGTLETLLSSPAGRSEIVLGKLLTIMLFSIVTALLNLASVAVTGCWCLRGCPVSGRRRRWPWRPWRSPWCRWPRCSAPCAWRWPPWPAARRKANTTSCRCCWWPCRW